LAGWPRLGRLEGEVEDIVVDDDRRDELRAAAGTLAVRKQAIVDQYVAC
jgi:hypothetical protein